MYNRGSGAASSGVESSKVARHVVQNDILTASTSRAGRTSIRPSRRCLITGPCSPTAARTFRGGTRSASAATTSARRGQHRRAGSRFNTPFLNGIATQAGSDAGLAVDFHPCALSLPSTRITSSLEEVAKFRAARKLWAVIMRERASGAINPNAPYCVFTRRRRQYRPRAAAGKQHRGGWRCKRWRRGAGWYAVAHTSTAKTRALACRRRKRHVVQVPSADHCL